MFALVVSFLGLYLAPGYFLSRFFKGGPNRSPFFYLLLSFLFLPIFYQAFFVLGLSSATDVYGGIAFFGAFLLAVQRWLRPAKISLEVFLPAVKSDGFCRLAAVAFFFMLMLPRLGLWQGYFPIGDDVHQVRKVVSVATSQGEPLFYHFPSTRLTIYYFNNVAPGLWVKLSQNQIKAHQAWFVHAALQSALLLWLLLKLAAALFSTNFMRRAFFYSLTYFSGFEVFLHFFRNRKSTDQLEWWTDWWLPQSRVHLQVTNPYNLFFWVPQHLMAAIYLVLIYILQRSESRHRLLAKIFMAVLWANILGNSAFVFLTGSVVYGLWQLVEGIRSRSLAQVIRLNLFVGGLAALLSIQNLELFLTAEKGHYLVSMMNVFWFVHNAPLWGKIVNLILTAPLYFLVEFGLLFAAMIFAFYKFFKDKTWREGYLFFYLYLFFLPVIFFIKALDDNNVSDRAFIPAQMGLAIFGALFLAKIWTTIRRRRVRGLILFLVLFLSSATTFSEFRSRLSEQFAGPELKVRNFMERLDEKLPLPSLVFSPYYQAELVTALGHRFSLKDPGLFNATDRQHTAASRVESYRGLNFGEGKGIQRVLSENPDLLEDFNLYSLSSVSFDKILSGDKIFEQGGLSVYPLKIEP